MVAGRLGAGEDVRLGAVLAVGVVVRAALGAGGTLAVDRLADDEPSDRLTNRDLKSVSR
jgi:hypothetical protein